MTQEMVCGCRPGFSRCGAADAMWEAANAVYKTQGYDAWMKALEPYNEHMDTLICATCNPSHGHDPMIPSGAHRPCSCDVSATREP